MGHFFKKVAGIAFLVGAVWAIMVMLQMAGKLG